MWWLDETDKALKTAQNEPGTASDVVFVVWCILLVPWAIFALMAGMAFDGGPTWQAYTFVGSVWTYPLTLAAAGLFRRRVSWVICAPLLNLAGVLITGL